MIKKVKTINNLAVFQNFKWDETVLEKNNKKTGFKEINILYGRNYSGKTTLSRIFRALESGVLSDKYKNPDFEVEIKGDNTVTQSNLKDHKQTIRVFNEDFVKEKLRFMVDDEEKINAFAILGDDNVKLEKEIEEKQKELGSEEEKTGLLGELKQKTVQYTQAKNAVGKTQSDLDQKLKDKANKKGTGIKHNKVYGDANYNINGIKADIKKVLRSDYPPIDDDKVIELNALLKEERKPNIPEPPQLNLQFISLLEETKELVGKKITLSDPIKELIEDSTLQNWVRSGIELHRDKKTTCGFCGNPLPSDLWEKLDKHFNKESESLQTAIKAQIDLIDNESKRTDSLMTFSPGAFYSTYSDEIETISQSFSTTSKDYEVSLKHLSGQLKKRQNDIFTPFELPDIEDVSGEFTKIRSQYETLRIKSNEFTDSLKQKQDTAKDCLRLHEVFTFIADIKYVEELEKIEQLKVTEKQSLAEQTESQQLVNAKREDIKGLKNQLKDESKGADRVNVYLNDFFGHNALSLRAVEGEDGYLFEVIRDSQKAYHLSVGECSLIAFCYFMAKLEDVETKGSEPIIWIDDPVSSLDSNHIFFVYSLINVCIVKEGLFRQLFISTHNLDFLKYMKKLIPKNPQGKSYERQFFIIERTKSGSQILLMPHYLKEYVTEFNYLFHQLYKCAKADIVDDGNCECYYNFGNNARKFLEAFLYYKYPDAKDDNNKLIRFFGENDLATLLTDRMNNEYSHLAGTFERSTTPVEVPEMKKAAQFILQKINEKDPEQYTALLESIGESIMETTNA